MSDVVDQAWVLIPLVAIIGGLTYTAFDKWQDGEEKRREMEMSGAGEDLQRRLRRIEQDLDVMRMELTDTVKDVDERLMRIEILLKEVE